jgi:hypothetical protein
MKILRALRNGYTELPNAVYVIRDETPLGFLKADFGD